MSFLSDYIRLYLKIHISHLSQYQSKPFYSGFHRNKRLLPSSEHTCMVLAEDVHCRYFKY